MKVKFILKNFFKKFSYSMPNNNYFAYPLILYIVLLNYTISFFIWGVLIKNYVFGVDFVYFGATSLDYFWGSYLYFSLNPPNLRCIFFLVLNFSYGNSLSSDFIHKTYIMHKMIKIKIIYVYIYIQYEYILKNTKKNKNLIFIKIFHYGLLLSSIFIF